MNQKSIHQLKQLGLTFAFLMVIDFSIGVGVLIVLLLAVFKVFQVANPVLVYTITGIISGLFIVAFCCNLVEYFRPQTSFGYVVVGYLFFPLSIPYLLLKKKVSQTYQPGAVDYDPYFKKDLYIWSLIISALMAFCWLSMIGIGIFYRLGDNPTLGLNFIIYGSVFLTTIVIGITFNALNYHYPKPIFATLAWFGLIINWVYLLWSGWMNRAKLTVGNVEELSVEIPLEKNDLQILEVEL